MRLQFQVFTIFMFSTTTVLSENASLLSINATVGIGGTLAPVAGSGTSNTTAPSSNATVAPTTISMHNLTMPPSTNLSAAVTVTTPAPLTTVAIHTNLTIPAATSAPTVSNATNSTGTTSAPLTTLSVLTTHAPAVSNSTGTTLPSLTTVSSLGATTTKAPVASNTTGTSLPSLTTVSSAILTTTKAPTASNSTLPSLTTVVSSNSTATTTRLPAAAFNSTGTTPKPSTKFPETCQSVDFLVQSGECYYALEGLDAEMGSSSLTDSRTISLLNGYCNTFSTCYPAIEKCADFDPDSISIIKNFCDFYQFVTSSGFLSCAQNMEGLSTPCTDNATETILNFNSTVSVRCAKLMAVKSCSYEEVDLWCNMAAYQNYEKFVNRHIQTWMCQT
ncbi:unnamed protein product [Caenorhabditis brenneri]